MTLGVGAGEGEEVHGTRSWHSQVGQQRAVDAHFEAAAPYWNQVYSSVDVSSWLFRERLAATLTWIDGLNLPTGAKVLDAGCGAGLATVALARRGYTVDAIDPAESMVALTLHNLDKAGFKDMARVRRGDVHALDAEPRSYDVVLGLGLVPWLHSPERALSEMARVLKPGGHLIATCANRHAVSYLLEPMQSPPLEPLRNAVTATLRRLGLRQVAPHGVRARWHRRREFDALIAGAELERLKGRTFGFGPFSMFRKTLPGSIGTQLQDRLQRLADQGIPGIRSAGSAYMVLARKPNAGDSPAIHRTADVSPSARVGARTRVWNEAQIREGADVGSDCVLAKGVYIDIDVVVGNRVKLENRVSLFQGTTLADGVFVGPHSCLLNDKLPRAVTPDGVLKDRAHWHATGVAVAEGASIGGGCTILPGVRIGRFALIGAGAVVTKDVPEFGLVYGNPARIVGYVCECGARLSDHGDCPACGRKHETKSGEKDD